MIPAIITRQQFQDLMELSSAQFHRWSRTPINAAELRAWIDKLEEGESFLQASENNAPPYPGPRSIAARLEDRVAIRVIEGGRT